MKISNDELPAFCAVTESEEVEQGLVEGDGFVDPDEPDGLGCAVETVFEGAADIDGAAVLGDIVAPHQPPAGTAQINTPFLKHPGGGEHAGLVGATVAQEDEGLLPTQKRGEGRGCA